MASGGLKVRSVRKVIAEVLGSGGIVASLRRDGSSAFTGVGTARLKRTSIVGNAAVKRN
jgi:hypothetical protein